MNVHKLRMDTSGNVEDISFVLAKKNGDKLGNITNIDNIVTKHSMKEASEFTFTAHKKIGDNIIRCWNDIKDFKLVWIPEWDMWYEITVEVNEKDENVKNVSGKTLGEAELSQIMLYGIEINTETDIAREEYKIPTTFYNPDHPEASLMDRLLTDKAPHYKIKHIDKSLMNLQRTFTFDDTSIYDALQEVSEELDCLFIFGCGSDENGKPERTIAAYDLEANCINCGNRDTFVHKCPKCGSTNIILGYGEYTNVFISRDNLADEITYSVDTDSVKNCMKLEAGDDLMTAAIRSCNPNGTDYIYYFPDETREEMSPELQEKLKSYDALYEKYQSDYNFTINDSFVTNYNALVNKYKTYEESLKDTEIKNPIVGYPKLMRIYFDTIDMVQLLRNKLMPPVDKPDNNAKSQGEYLMANLPSSASTTSLKNLSVSTADNIMVMLAQSIVKGVFKVTVTNTTLSNNVWKGKFNLENYSDKDDTFTSQFVSISINENYESYVKQRIDSILARSDENYYDIVGLFKQDMTVFKSQLKKYCLNTLQIFQKGCQSCIDMMVQQGISSNSTSSIYGVNTKVLYENVYIPYYNKMNAIQDEIKVREDELYTVEGKYNNQNQLVQDGIQIEIERIITEVQDALNFKNYIGIDLYKEFSSFIRMDKYSNDNYISDGLNNTDLMKNAIEFITVATKELYKSATLQHSITGTIKNFLRMKEFEPVTNNFKNGNWICVGIDDKVYQLRIIEYEIDFSDTQNISVTFSDVVSTPDGMTDLESILSNSSKMATSYNGVVRQSTINTDFKNKMNEMIAKGLSMTNTKIVSNADNQDITWDEHGLLCREYDDILSDYTDSQLKIINHGIYITDDNWKTARAGIGNFIYYDPKDKTYKESYGVIADTLVSNLILTSEVGIYNEEKSIEMAKDGIIVTTNTMNKNVFTIRKEITDDEGNITYERQLYIDDNGNIVLGGNASISWDNIIDKDGVLVKDTLNKFLESIQEQLDGKVETFRQETDPSLEWTDEEKVKHNGDLWYNTKTNSTYIYNGSQWDEFTGDVPDEVWDKIDGKSQIFIKTPVPPYNTGDLWFTESKELFTCVQNRKEGESFNSADWEKKVNYTDDTTANGVKSDLEKLAYVLGYNGTTITGTYIYSPHILGGDLAIGDKTGIHASITTDGKLSAVGADISGNITANSLTLGSGVKIPYANISDSPNLTIYISKDGTIGTISDGSTGFSVSTEGLLQASNAIIYGTIYASNGKIGGLTLASNSIKSSNGNFSVTSGGKLTATDATITGNITATSGSFTGAITATSLTLGSGVSIGASKVSGLSSVATSGDYNDLDNKPEIPNVTYYIRKDGTVGAEPSEGSTGFKVSSNGLLQASNAIIYGKIVASSGKIGGFEISTHLDNSDHAYENTLYVQTTDGSGNTYQSGIRGNTSNNDPSGAAFYVRKKTSNMTSWADAEYPFVVRKNGRMLCTDITIGDSLNMLMQDDYNDESKKVKAISTDSISTKFGYISGNTSAYMAAWKDGTNKGVLSFHVSGAQALNIQKQGSGLNSYFAFYPSGTTVNLGLKNDRFSTLYIDTVTFSDGTSMTTAKTSGDASSYGSLTNKPGINGHTLASGNNTLSDLGIAARSHSHSSSDINWSTTLGYKGFGHCHTIIMNSNHTMSVALTKDSKPALIPYYVSSFNSVDNMTLGTGSGNIGCTLGNSNYQWDALYVKELWLNGNKITSSGGGTTNYNNLSNRPQINSVMLSGNTSLDDLGIGTRLSLYGTTLYLEKSNGTTIDYVSLDSLSGGGSNDNTEIGSSAYSYYVQYLYESDSGSSFYCLRPNHSGTTTPYTYLGDNDNYWKKLNAMSATTTHSDKYLKENICDFNNINGIDSFFMELTPVSYHFKYYGELEDHYGFIAQDVEQSLLKYGLNPDKLGLVYRNKLSKPNPAGKMIQYTLAYDEFIPINTYMTQKAHHRIDSLTQENQKLKNTIFSLQGEIAIIKQKLEELA